MVWPKPTGVPGASASESSADGYGVSASGAARLTDDDQAKLHLLSAAHSAATTPGSCTIRPAVSVLQSSTARRSERRDLVAEVSDAVPWASAESVSSFAAECYGAPAIEGVPVGRWGERASLAVAAEFFRRWELLTLPIARRRPARLTLRSSRLDRIVTVACGATPRVRAFGWWPINLDHRLSLSRGPP